MPVTTIIRTAEPSRFAGIAAASGIGLCPFSIDKPVVVRLVRTATR